MTETATNLYCDYLKLDYKQKLHKGSLLEEAGRLLLDSYAHQLPLADRIQREHLTPKIAEDLLRQSISMGYSKAYEFSPKIRVYTELAFELMYILKERKANKALAPYLKAFLHYKKEDPDFEHLYNEVMSLTNI